MSLINTLWNNITLFTWSDVFAESIKHKMKLQYFAIFSFKAYVHISIPCFLFKPYWLSLVSKHISNLSNINLSSTFDSTHVIFLTINFTHVSLMTDTKSKDITDKTLYTWKLVIKHISNNWTILNLAFLRCSAKIESGQQCPR